MVLLKKTFLSPRIRPSKENLFLLLSFKLAPPLHFCYSQYWKVLTYHIEKTEAERRKKEVGGSHYKCVSWRGFVEGGGSVQSHSNDSKKVWYSLLIIVQLLLLHYLSDTGLYKFGENPSIRTKIETLILAISITTWKKINKIIEKTKIISLKI